MFIPCVAWCCCRVTLTITTSTTTGSLVLRWRREPTRQWWSAIFTTDWRVACTFTRMDVDSFLRTVSTTTTLPASGSLQTVTLLSGSCACALIMQYTLWVNFHASAHPVDGAGGIMFAGCSPSVYAQLRTCVCVCVWDEAFSYWLAVDFYWVVNHFFGKHKIQWNPFALFDVILVLSPENPPKVCSGWRTVAAKGYFHWLRWVLCVPWLADRESSRPVKKNNYATCLQRFAEQIDE